jgi:hypothetical protein
MVTPGDTTYTIARDLVGDGSKYPELVDANPHKITTIAGMFETLTPGETLMIPIPWAKAQPGAAAEITAVAGPEAAGIGDAGYGSSDSPDAGALPYGWTSDDVRIAVELASNYEIDPEDLFAIWYSESGLQPHLGPVAGYYGLIMGNDQFVTSTAGLAPGTWRDIVLNSPLAVQLQAIAKYYDAQARIWLKESYASRAAKLGVTPAGVLYALQFVPAYASQMKTADQPMVMGGTAFYNDNPGFDVTNKGYITIRDMDLRIARKKSEANGAQTTAPLLAMARMREGLPFQGLASLFSSTDSAWSQVTGQSPYVSASWSTSKRGAAGGAAGIVLAVALGLAAWKYG